MIGEIGIESFIKNFKILVHRRKQFIAPNMAWLK
jgi:hypothetical protein